MKFLAFIITCFLLNTINGFSQEQEVFTSNNQSISIANKIDLYHDLYLPNNAKNTYETILIRTPYAKQNAALFGQFFAKHNYAVVIQDVRGKNKSEGTFVPFINERSDGLETLNWIADQKWSNGKIAAWGSSYLSYCALILADTNHPALKSVFNLSGWIDGEKVNNPGGALHQMLIIPWLLSDGQTSIASEQGLDLEEMFAYKPLRDAIPGNADIFRDNKIDLSGVSKNTTSFNYKNVNIPVFHINGWYDFTAQSTIDAYSELHKHSKSKQQLVLGPWYHNQIYEDSNEIGDYMLPDSGIMEMEELLEISVKWFDNTLRQGSSKSSDKNIKYYVLFEDAWHNSKQWPPKHRKEELYLGSNNLLTYKKAKSLNSESSFLFNPEKPTPTLGGANFYFFADKMGIKDQNEIERRDDVLLFTSSAFDRDKIIAGNITLDLYIKTEGKSTDFTAKLTLVDTNGTSRNIVDGIVRVSKNELKNSVTNVKIDLGDTAFKVLRGENLRLQISSSNYPKFNRNPNTGEDPLDALVYKEVEQTILHSKKHPSKLILPILKN